MHFVYAYNPTWIKQLKSNNNFKTNPGAWEHYLIFSGIKDRLLSGSTNYIDLDYEKYRKLFFK